MDFEQREERERLGLVPCDSNCSAKLEPQTLVEYQFALEHYRFHGYLCGCSHGR